MGIGSMRAPRGRKGRRGGPNAAVIVLGLAGAAGGAWLVRARPWRGTEVASQQAAGEGALALSVPAGVPRGGQAPAQGPINNGPVEVDASAVPAELRHAVERPAAEVRDAWGLLDLRRLAVEFPGTPEGRRAVEMLAGERQRCQALAAQAQNDPPEALTQLTRVWLSTTDAAARRAMRPQLMELSQKVIFDPRGTTSVVEYKAQPGDSLARIGKQQHADWRFIQRLSGLKNANVRVGQRLRIPAAEVRVVVFKRDFELGLLFDGRWMHGWDVATGKDGCTPEAEFVIGNKMVDPDWYSPEGKVYKFGSEENVLGTRWLAFENTAEHQGFGIHGTKFPESIGSEASMGCIRLRNQEVEVLFDLVPSGSKVRIQK